MKDIQNYYKSMHEIYLYQNIPKLIKSVYHCILPDDGISRKAINIIFNLNS